MHKHIHTYIQGSELVPCEREGAALAPPSSSMGVQEPLTRAVVSLGRKSLQEMRASFAAGGVGVCIVDVCVCR